MKVTFLTEATRDDTLTEAKGLRDIPELSSVRVRPSLPQATRDHRDALYYGVTHTTINPNKIVRCVYNARVEEYELRFLYHDEERDFDRIDWQTSVPYSDGQPLYGQRERQQLQLTIAREDDVTDRPPETDDWVTMMTTTLLPLHRT